MSAPLEIALARLYARIPLGMRLGLERMRAACAAHGNPERDFKTVHVAGTNGKGSVCAMLDSIARAHGLHTGLYTSPHLCRFSERIRVDGEPVADPVLAALLTRALDTTEDLSFFEASTLAAFLAFREAHVDLAIVEVGIGGRLDATNVLPTPAGATITRIALDHVDRLGPTLTDIAREKAGIAKPGLDIVLGPISPDLRAVIDQVAHASGATTSGSEDATVVPILGLAGDHQRDNARIAAVLGARIGASAEAVAQGLTRVTWPARLERIGDYLLDAAHNPDGTEALARYLRRSGPPPDRVSLVFGTLADKDWRSMLGTLAPLATTRIYLAPQGSARSAADPREMAAVHSGSLASDVEEALTRAANDTALVVVCGSIALVGQARARLCRLPCDPSVAL
ncbi:MAG TPA: folylpolyglutamate synthase/dihydrofolate synthase family protein [Polyangiaceae bacterium]|nr:folylpolyglutamate synthase/dihydrofolate synthase family protein [Polyangiaceae bacterium]